MSVWSLTCQESVFKRCHSDKHFSEFLPTRWRQKSTGIDVERNYVTVTLCISAISKRRFSCLWFLRNTKRNTPGTKSLSQFARVAARPPEVAETVWGISSCRNRGDILLRDKRQLSQMDPRDAPSRCTSSRTSKWMLSVTINWPRPSVRFASRLSQVLSTPSDSWPLRA